MATSSDSAATSPEPSHPTTSDTIYHLSFNQDFSCLIVGTENGYKIFNWESLDKIRMICDNAVPNVIIAERLFSSSLMAVVSMDSPRNMKLSHLKKNRNICDYLFTDSVLAVQLTRKRIIVCLEFKIIVHSVIDLKVAHEINNTPSNPKGLFAVSTCPNNTLIAYPGSKNEGLVQIFDAIHMQALSLIRAHDSALAALVFDEAGTKLATASEKGTVIRIFNVKTNQKIQELRRGLKRADIYSLTFALNSTVVVASSSTETVHIFKVTEPTPAPVLVDDSGVMGWLTSAVSTSATYLPSPMTDMLQQERAYATVTLPFCNLKNVSAVTMIENQPYILVAAVDGYLYIYKLNLAEGGECSLVKQQKLNFASPVEGVSPDERITSRNSYARAVKGVSASAPLTETERIKEVTDAVQSLDVGLLSDQFP